MATATYNPKKVIFSFNGYQVKGFGDGTMIKAARSEDSFSTQVGADGEVARAVNANKMGEVEVTLQQTSASNDVLSDLLAADELSQGGVASLQIKDASGRTVLSANEAWIKKMPDVEHAKENGTRVWVFTCANLEIIKIGGN